ncbi:MAG: HAD family hydrolase [Candidatus Azobacteroides sp.]|nr:HAD family hydrolase [Candidatus Azobacteroides sp.]
MLDISKIKGIIFDYGGTIDSNGKHWAEVLWNAYEDNQVPVSKKDFRDAYVYGERYLATHYVIEPTDTFKNLLEKKVDLQINWLVEKGFLHKNDKTSQYSIAVSNQCYNFATSTLQRAKPVIQKLCGQYPLVLVSNFYGNVESVLDDFGITSYFKEIVESAIVGIRKPDPAIFALGVKALEIAPAETIVIGDSYSKDIVPATKIGCKTIWLKGIGWEDEDLNQTADVVISDFRELDNIFFKSRE